MQKNVLEADQSFQEMLHTVISRLERKSELGSLLRQALMDLPLSNWQAAPGILEIDDSEQAIILPSDCLLVQVAAQRDNRVFYDQILFAHMDELNRLALVVHELTYKVAVALGQKDSQRARQAVGVILSKDEFEAHTPYSVYETLKPFGEFAFT